jgi:hypothetical protein
VLEVWRGLAGDAMSKGSTPRRCQVSREDYERRWEKALGDRRQGDRRKHPEWAMAQVLSWADKRAPGCDRRYVRYNVAIIEDCQRVIHAEPDATGHP